MEKIELSYPNKEFKIKEIWIDLSKQSIWKIKEIKIKAIQILDISNFLKFWNSLSKHKVKEINQESTRKQWAAKIMRKKEPILSPLIVALSHPLLGTIFGGSATLCFLFFPFSSSFFSIISFHTLLVSGRSQLRQHFANILSPSCLLFEHSPLTCVANTIGDDSLDLYLSLPLQASMQRLLWWW